MTKNKKINNFFPALKTFSMLFILLNFINMNKGYVAERIKLQNILNILNKNRFAEQEQFKDIDHYETRQAEQDLIRTFPQKLKSTNLFLNLFTDRRNNSMDLIREITNLQQNSRLAKLLNYSFYSSHLFLTYSFLEGKGLYRQQLERKEAMYKIGDVTIKSKTRAEGLFFGIIVDNVSDNINGKMKYFIKSYKNYLVNNDKFTFTGDTTISSLPTHVSNQNINSPLESTPCIPSVYEQKFDIDLKELFVYKLLERLKFGARVDFFVNPYLKRALFIQSTDLNAGQQQYNQYKPTVELQEIIRREQGQIPVNGVRQEIHDYEIKLTEMDLVVRSLLLTDMHQKNIMFIRQQDKKDCKTYYDFKIIDFFAPRAEEIEEKNQKSFVKTLKKMQKEKIDMSVQQCYTTEYFEETANPYVLANMSTSFITANTLTRYSEINGERQEIQTAVSSVLKRDAESLEDRNHKRTVGLLALRILEERLQTIRRNRLDVKANFATIMQEAQSDIIDFMYATNSIVQQRNFELLMLTEEQIAKKQDDLRTYQNGILQNLQSIINFIDSQLEQEQLIEQ